ncbi:MAG: response regulator [Cyanobacteria bacterium]|nr:response regulator [Cyanobacteriota bacterium]MDW8200802.1 response regulator [Cyanobacteriota bacterium SKYGB_h_bin112]
MSAHKILVIDDSKVIRNTVRDMLPKGNFEVLEAKDGIEGLNLIRQEHPNLIMLDFLLPKMSGWEVYQQIQAQSDLQRIPLVLMSGRKEEVTEKIPEPFSRFAFIEKPFEQKDLVDAIKTAMDIARKMPAPVLSAEPSAVSSAGSEEFEALKAKVNELQSEVEDLKKKLAQVVTIIKQKLK